MDVFGHNHISKKYKIVVQSDRLDSVCNRISEAIIRQNRKSVVGGEGYETGSTVVVVVLQFHD
jgi:hypothetical protein